MKNLTTVSKGLIMAVITLIAGIISANGFPATSTEWIILVVSVVGGVLTYLGKNALWSSTSTVGTISVGDLLSGLFLALGSGLSNWIGTLVAGTVFSWHALLVFVGTQVLGYLAKNFATKNPTP